MSQISSSAPATGPNRGGLDLRNLDWTVVIAIAALHVIALAALMPRFFSWSGLILFVVMFWVTACLGITLTFHRLLTHRSFKTPKWFEYFLTICGCLSWQGSPATWVGVHRLHHKHSDGDLDPHSPKHGFTWAHILWTLHDKLDGIDGRSAAKDLLRDKGLRLIDTYYWVPQVVLAAVFLGVGWAIGGIDLGVSWVVWGVALRTILVFHGTWFVNSAAHTWGYQNYESTGEQSTNLWWVALVSFGEGWHNNHHALPRSAAHGLRWFELDPTYWVIKALSKVGLATDVWMPKPEQMPQTRPVPKPAVVDVVVEPRPSVAQTARARVFGVAEVAQEIAAAAQAKAQEIAGPASDTAHGVALAVSDAAHEVAEYTAAQALALAEATSAKAQALSEVAHEIAEAARVKAQEIADRAGETAHGITEAANTAATEVAEAASRAATEVIARIQAPAATPG